jgi:ribosomal protein L40E
MKNAHLVVNDQKFYEHSSSKQIPKEKTHLVYCSKCGTLNPESAVNCSNCGSPLYKASSNEAPYYGHEQWRRYYEEGYNNRHRGSGIWLLIVGLIVVLFALALFFQMASLFWQYFWPVVFLLIGLWIITLGLRHRRKYSPSSPQ